MRERERERAIYRLRKTNHDGMRRRKTNVVRLLEKPTRIGFFPQAYVSKS